MSEFPGKDEPDDPEHPLKTHEDKIDALHLSIFAMVQRAAGNPLYWKLPRYESAKAYHPAYTASRIQQLESLVGTMAAVMLEAGIMTEEKLTNMLGQTYVTDIKELELRGAALNATVFLGASKAQRERESLTRSQTTEENK